MSVISEGFKLGNIVISKKYTMTRTEMESIGDGEGYPDVFPVWCTDDNCLYIFYKTTDGTANIVNYNNLVESDQVNVMYPIVDTATGQLSWEIRTMTGEVPDPVILEGLPGKSAYEVWLDEGNVGTEKEFLDSLRGNFSDLTDDDIEALKVALGFDKLEATITEINMALDDINS